MEGLSAAYVFWDANDHTVDLKKPKVELNELKQELSEKPSRPSKGLVDIKQWKKLNATKDRISTANNWKKWSRLVNPYEKISVLSSRNYGKDYYKLYEMIKFYNLESVDSFLCLCEAPGAFTRALNHFNPKADWYATSYYSHGTPEFDANAVPNDKIITTDDLTDYDTIQIIKDFAPKCGIITADGAFDTSHDPTNQEQLSLHLIYSQILTALMCQEEGGTFILKLFDTFTRPTCQMIYLLTHLYDQVSLLKPRTSRLTNSEKYLIARGFKGVSNPKLIESMIDISLN